MKIVSLIFGGGILAYIFHSLNLTFDQFEDIHYSYLLLYFAIFFVSLLLLIEGLKHYLKKKI